MTHLTHFTEQIAVHIVADADRKKTRLTARIVEGSQGFKLVADIAVGEEGHQAKMAGDDRRAERAVDSSLDIRVVVDPAQWSISYGGRSQAAVDPDARETLQKLLCNQA